MYFGGYDAEIGVSCGCFVSIMFLVSFIIKFTPSEGPFF